MCAFIYTYGSRETCAHLKGGGYDKRRFRNAETVRETSYHWLLESVSAELMRRPGIRLKCRRLPVTSSRP
jgi:hypothetical protein